MYVEILHNYSTYDHLCCYTYSFYSSEHEGKKNPMYIFFPSIFNVHFFFSFSEINSSMLCQSQLVSNLYCDQLILNFELCSSSKVRCWSVTKQLMAWKLFYGLSNSIVNPTIITRNFELSRFHKCKLPVVNWVTGRTSGSVGGVCCASVCLSPTSSSSHHLPPPACACQPAPALVPTTRPPAPPASLHCSC